MWLLFLIFLKIGFLGFGGGYAILSLLFEETQKLGITASQFADLNALDLVVPGPVAINGATYVGYLTQGVSGALIATLAVSISSYVFVLLYVGLEDYFLKQSWIHTFFELVKKSAVGLIFSVAVVLTYRVIYSEQSVINPLAVASLLFGAFLRFKLKVNAILVVISCGAFAFLLTLFFS